MDAPKIHQTELLSYGAYSESVATRLMSSPPDAALYSTGASAAGVSAAGVSVAGASSAGGSTATTAVLLVEGSAAAS